MAAFALAISGLMPVAHAAMAASEDDVLLAAICSPQGIRYVEIDVATGGSERQTPRQPGGLDHCPGCLAGGSVALLPASISIPAPLAGDRIAGAYRETLFAGRIGHGYRPRAPPDFS